MATYRVNGDRVAKARSTIDAHLDSDWSAAQPDNDEENEKLDRDGYDGLRVASRNP